MSINKSGYRLPQIGTQRFSIDIENLMWTTLEHVGNISEKKTIYYSNEF